MLGGGDNSTPPCPPPATALLHAPDNRTGIVPQIQHQTKFLSKCISLAKPLGAPSHLLPGRETRGSNKVGIQKVVPPTCSNRPLMDTNSLLASHKTLSLVTQNKFNELKAAILAIHSGNIQPHILATQASTS